MGKLHVPDTHQRQPQRAAINSDLVRIVQQLPKVDLHAHLTGCLRPQTVGELAGVRDAARLLRLPELLVRYSDFFTPWDSILACVPDSGTNIHRMILEVAEDFAAQNVRYAELRISARRALLDGSYDDWITAIVHACETAQNRFGFSPGIILG